MAPCFRLFYGLASVSAGLCGIGRTIPRVVTSDDEPARSPGPPLLVAVRAPNARLGSAARAIRACNRRAVRHPLRVRGAPNRAGIRTGALAAAVIACTHVAAGSTRDDEADFGSYRTFAVGVAPERVESLPEYDRAIGETIRNELGRGLRTRGLRSTTADRADLAVSFRVSGRGGFSVTGDSFGDNAHVAPYVEGHLSVAVFDRHLERMVWHGWAALKEYRAGEGEEHARRAAREVIHRFPRRDEQ